VLTKVTERAGLQWAELGARQAAEARPDDDHEADRHQWEREELTARQQYDRRGLAPMV
jgi:hypothetical protein